jgi:hypothetical protein
MANVSVNLPSEAALRTIVLDGFAEQLDARFRAALPRLRSAVGAIVDSAIKESPEAASLVRGRLRHLLGVVDAGPVLAAIGKNVAEAMNLSVVPVRRQGQAIVGGIRLEVLKKDLSEVLSVPGAYFISEGRYEVPWLEWLLTAGDRVVVSEHHFAAGFSHKSRTGEGVMVRGANWRVPSEFSGTRDNNFVTRAVALAGPAIQRAVAAEVL